MTKSGSRVGHLMAGTRSKVRMGAGAKIAWGAIAAGFLFIALNSYALELGAAHHDAFCPEHGWAA